MKRATLIGSVGLWTALVLLSPVQAQTPISGGARNAPETPSAATAIVLQLSAEVKRLTSEVHQLQLELQGLRLRQLETDLREVQGEQQRLIAQEDELRQVIGELAQQLGDNTLPAQERQTLEIARTELVDGHMGKLRAAQQTAAERNAELNRLLEQARSRWKGLVSKARELKPAADVSPQH